MISASQIRAARAMLGWSQEDMAEKSCLSVATISNLEKSRNLEKCHIVPRSAIEIRKACEKSGIEFIAGDGVRRRKEEIVIYNEYDSCERFFEDLLQAAKSYEGVILAAAKSQSALCQSLGIGSVDSVKQLEQLAKLTPIHCLLSEPDSISLFVSACEFKISPKNHIGSAAYFIYGDFYAVVLSEGDTNFRFIVIRSVNQALSAKQEFMRLWNEATPFMIQGPTEP